MWCDERRRYENVGAEEVLYWVFEGMPMGWTWALYFCQNTMEAAAEEATPASGDGRGWVAQDSVDAPIVAEGWPVSSVYVDNALVVCWNRRDAVEALSRWKSALEGRSLLFHDVVAPCRSLVYVGLIVDVNEPKQVRHTPLRLWRLYRSWRQVRRSRVCTSAVMEVLLGHIVFVFIIRPAALSILSHCYSFVERRDPRMR